MAADNRARYRPRYNGDRFSMSTRSRSFHKPISNRHERSLALKEAPENGFPAVSVSELWPQRTSHQLCNR